MGSVIYGLVACGIAAFCTGSGFVPIRRYPPNDGFFNQLILCIGTFCVAFVVNCIQGFPDVQPLVLIGGAIWATGNAFGISIVNNLGLGISVLLWNVSSCVIGWSQTKFGWPNLPVEHIEGVWMNYIGIVILICSATVYVFVKSEAKSILTEDDLDRKTSFETPRMEKTDDEFASETAKGTSLARKTLAFVGALLTGVAYGTMFIPITYIQKHKENFKRHGSVLPTDQSLDYVFSFFIGALLASIAVFLIYSLLMRNRPVIDNQVMLPSFVSGLSFGICQTFFIVANQELSQSISYPLCTMLPGFVASLWSVFYFKEISGTRNYLLLGFAYTLTLIGVICVAYSKNGGF